MQVLSLLLPAPLFLASSLPWAGPVAPDPVPPGPHNILVIVVDDIGVDLIGAYEPFYENHPHPDYPLTTPAIDYLAETGLLFRNAWTNPSCSPSRAQILTGKHAHRNGIGRVVHAYPPVTDGTGLDPAQDTIPSMLRGGSPEVRYHTAALGKWHLGDATQQQAGRPAHPLGTTTRPWFHQFAGSYGNITKEAYSLWTKTFATPVIPGSDECAPEAPGFCEAQVTEYATADTANDAIHQIRTMREPFFLQVSFNAAHKPLEAPEDPLTAASCHEDGLQGEPVCDFANNVPAQTRCLVQWMDNEIGRILCALEDDPRMPDLPVTIVFLADNGTKREAVVAPFHLLHGKGTFFQLGINVPFIVKSPWIDPELVGTSTEALVCSTDIFATVAQLAGVPEPPDPHGLRDSKSFLRVLQGSSPSMREFVYAEQFKSNFQPTPEGTPPSGFKLRSQKRAIRDRVGFKLVQRVIADGDGGVNYVEQFFDLAADPMEMSDEIVKALSGEEPYASAYASLRAELDASYPYLVTD